MYMSESIKLVVGGLEQCFLCAGPSRSKESDINSRSANYARIYNVLQIKFLPRIQGRFQVMAHNIPIDTVYLETHRDTAVVDDEKISNTKQFISDFMSFE
jgi:hypothetical protein